jgi:cytochrome c oxidase cbb3-type subunit 3
MKTENLQLKKIVLALAVLGSSLTGFAQSTGEAAAKPESITADPLFWVLLLVTIALLYVIYALSEMIVWDVKRKSEKRKGNSTLVKSVLLLLGTGLLIANPVNAQEAMAQPASSPSFWSDPFLPFYLLITIEVLIISWLSYLLFNMLAPEKESAVVVKRENILIRIWNVINPTLPVEREDEIRLDDHEYDGIVELGNKMPPWLQFMFYATILFALIYGPYYLLGYGKTMDEKYQDEMAEAEFAKQERMKNNLNFVDENTIELMLTSDVLSAGKEVFVKFCVACHGNGGEGSVGPNLTDDYWIHGGSIGDLFATIKYGVPAKGMASWQDILTAKEIGEVSNYIKSLYGTNPPNAKEPQGDLWSDTVTAPGGVDSTTAPKADSVVVAIK